MHKSISSSILAKAVLIIGAVTATFIILLFAMSGFYVQNTLGHIDDVSLNEKSIRLKEIFSTQLKTQNTLVKNWGVWDDLYEYAKKPNEKFEKANMGAANLDDLTSNFVLIFNAKRELVGFAAKDKSKKDIKNDFLTKSQCLSAPSQHQILQKITDSNCVETIAGQDILYAIHPIVQSDKSGPADGVVVFARWMDKSFYNEVSNLFGSTVQKVELKDLPKGVNLSKEHDLGWVDISSEKKDAYLYFGETSTPFALKFSFDRGLYSYGLDMLKKFALIGILVILTGSFLMFWFLKNQILLRLVGMSDMMGKIGLLGSIGYLPSNQKYSDEIEQMAQSANLMLNRLYLYQEELAKRSEDLESEVKAKIDEIREKDSAMIRQSRYATIGETIANISHQWREQQNDLWLLLQSLSVKFKAGKLDEEKFADSMAESKKLISYMSDTIGDFQTFFRPDKEKVAFFVGDMLNRSIAIANSSLKNNNIALGYSEEGKYIAFGVPNEFAQAVLNIINNARDAFSDKDISDKRIDISVENIAGMIVISIEDSAGGIDEKAIDSLFEPYFSTKYSKGGTGLGLYITKQAVEQCSGGAITAKNGERGAIFTIMLQEIQN